MKVVVNSTASYSANFGLIVCLKKIIRTEMGDFKFWGDLLTKYLGCI